MLIEIDRQCIIFSYIGNLMIKKKLYDNNDKGQVKRREKAVYFLALPGL